jgi:hypothetical protein
MKTPVPTVVTYFLLDEESQRLKIGRTTKQHRRVRDLENGCGTKLRLLHLIIGDREAHWHNRLKDHRLEGEWFRLSSFVARELREAFNIRIRAKDERSPGPPRQKSVVDWAATFEQVAETPLRTDFPRYDTPDDDPGEDFRFWLSNIFYGMALPRLEELRLEDLEDAESAELDEDFENAEFAELDEAIEAAVSEISKWRELLVGWGQTKGPRWLDLWLAFWKPAKPEAVIELRRAMVRAAESTDATLIEHIIRLRPCLIDRNSLDMEWLPPDELYNLALQISVRPLDDRVTAC